MKSGQSFDARFKGTWTREDLGRKGQVQKLLDSHCGCFPVNPWEMDSGNSNLQLPPLTCCLSLLSRTVHSRVASVALVTVVLMEGYACSIAWRERMESYCVPLTCCSGAAFKMWFLLNVHWFCTIIRSKILSHTIFKLLAGCDCHSASVPFSFAWSF